MNHLIREYFSFSKKERTGIIVLLLLILATIVIPYFLPAPPVKADPAAFEKLRQQMAQLEMARDSGGHQQAYARFDEPAAAKATVPVRLFEFDPNTLSPVDWKELGLRDRTILTIQRYLSRGGRFRRPEDLYKIYGLKKEEADRLVPYVRIRTSEQETAPAAVSFAAEPRPAPGNSRFSERRFVEPAVFDINIADTAAFIALRGIGPVLARRIVHFREKLGGFHSVEQVGETYGLPDSTFQQVKGYFRCAGPVLRTIPVNTADVQLLQAHPYISRPVANAIVQYREQHGPYQSLDQLLEINIITTPLWEKIRPYLVLEKGK